MFPDSLFLSFYSESVEIGVSVPYCAASWFDLKSSLLPTGFSMEKEAF